MLNNSRGIWYTGTDPRFPGGGANSKGRAPTDWGSTGGTRDACIPGSNFFHFLAIYGKTLAK